MQQLANRFVLKIQQSSLLNIQQWFGLEIGKRGDPLVFLHLNRFPFLPC